MKMTMKQIAEKYNLDKVKLNKAINILEEKDSFFYAMGGKMGSGKDTIGGLIKVRMINKGIKVDKLSYSNLMKDEVNQVVNMFNSKINLLDIANKLNTSESEIFNLLDILDGTNLTKRTKSTRQAIQYWSTEVRRKQDEDYWVNKMIEQVIDKVIDGKSVFISDVRYPVEVESITSIQGKVVKLDVPENIRVKRVWERDGREPSEEELNHASEKGLDDYKIKLTFNGNKEPYQLAEDITEFILGVK